MSFVTGHDGNAGDVVLIYAKLFVHFKGGGGWGRGEEEGETDHKCIVCLMG